MKNTYPFLRDEVALTEIRKHKWIESEKIGQEIGFATAAMDWIHKYGKGWLAFHGKKETINTVFAERRRHRRFQVNLPIEIKNDQDCITSYTQDVNLMGISCLIPVYISPQMKMEIVIHPPTGEASVVRPTFQFPSQVTRISLVEKDHWPQGYQVFFPFSEQARDYLEHNTQIFNQNN